MSPVSRKVARYGELKASFNRVGGVVLPCGLCVIVIAGEAIDIP